ncbi:hypothetical protein [Phytoactinopolyspora mesophila]|uniref:Zf-HC2 domain-containing protein n=1 Tax=Phytoactinopolyspora mesophila TaxID=2650750 RepID=A0A7K3M5V2_9ACTN|nr:hypothetical protein [Phytoactinopolyspora mesophila]NDL58397.1 hypothetical protein [Phytoactinopolyspora mesophila]
MTEPHPTEDSLLDLALGDVSEPAQQSLIHHLASCSDCRRAYDGVARTLDDTLAAAPHVQPRPGFDHAVLQAMGVGEAHHQATPPPRRIRWNRPATLLAACLAGVALGVGGTVAATTAGDDAPADSVAAAPGAPLQTEDGDTVGTAAFSYLDNQRVVVVTVAGGGDGHYECRLRLADGNATTLGEWHVPEAGATWVMPVPSAPVVSIELVDEQGAIWSTATL